MITIDSLTTFLGWCSVLNIAMLSFTTFLATVLKEPLIKTHHKLFGVAQDDLPLAYFHYLSNIKVAIFMLNVMPYTALKVMF